MKFFTAFVLALCLLSPAAQAETTLFGLTLGKSTLQEVEKHYTLHDKRTASGLIDRTYYNVSGNQFNEPQLEVATIYFDDTQTLEGILFTFPSSEQKYKELNEQLSRQYPRIEIEPFTSDPFGTIEKVEFRNDTTHVSLTYDYHAVFLGFLDLNSRTTSQLFKNKTLFGLTLGKSTLQEVKQTYTLQSKNTAYGLPDSWNYYDVSGEQFDEPQLKNAALYFDDSQKLGSIRFDFPSSIEKFKELEAHLSRQYPRIKTIGFVPNELLSNKVEFQNDTTYIRLLHGHHRVSIIFFDLNYHTIAQKRIAEYEAREADKPQKEPQT